jgi:hypothetical protein
MSGRLPPWGCLLFRHREGAFRVDLQMTAQALLARVSFVSSFGPGD